MTDPASAGLARPEFGINHVIAYGQSLSSGWEGWPALSVVPRHDSLMLGGSVRPVSEHSARWTPVGEAVFRPLVATVQDLATGALLRPGQVAGLPERTAALGETVLEGAVNFWRARMLTENPQAAAHPLLASSCGVGGRTLAALSKGAPGNLFNRLRDCASLAKATAAAQGRSYGIVALLFLQGENDNLGAGGDEPDRAAYRTLLRQWRADVLTDLVAGIAAQAAAPALFLYQTGGAYANDAHPVPMAQLDVALEDAGCFMVGPSYPVTDKAGHLDANGYRWLGAQFGKVMHNVLTLGQIWRPLYPLRAVLRERIVLANFAVPVAPLAWGQPFRGHRQVEVADKGFTVTDDDGVVPIVAVAFDGPDSVAITLARRPAGRAWLRYADRSRHAGRGCLHDSDPTLADDPYEYDALTGHYASANVAGWPGRRYPLMNWCVGFNIAIEADGGPKSALQPDAK